MADAEIAALERELLEKLKHKKRKHQPEKASSSNQESKGKTTQSQHSRPLLVAIVVLVLAFAASLLCDPTELASENQADKQRSNSRSAVQRPGVDTSGRRDTAAEARLEALASAKKKACPTCPRDKRASDEEQSEYWTLVFDTALALYKYR
jgi:hypothetical protein